MKEGQASTKMSWSGLADESEPWWGETIENGGGTVGPKPGLTERDNLNAFVNDEILENCWFVSVACDR
jgi:hypothetical protein